MTFNKKQIKAIISQEIEWHTNNKDKATMPEEWCDGFISGLIQLKKVINNIR